jgi:two-component system cell cycle sensor histidine kinase/response regulator CckA
MTTDNRTPPLRVQRRVLWVFVVANVLAVVVAGLLAHQLAEVRPEARHAIALVTFLFLVLSSIGVGVAGRLIRRWEAAENKLADYRKDLEERVDRRTAELTQANQQLRHEIKEREEAQQALRQRDAQFRQAQKMEAVGTLAGGIAHDFNNLLTGILGGVEMARMKLPADSRAAVDLDDASEAVGMAVELTRQILSFSRHQDTLFGAVDLNAIVADTARLLRHSIPETILIETALDESLPAVRCDRGQIGQALLNLGINARDAMPKGGVLGFTVSVVDLDEVSHHQGRAGRVIVIEVADTGTGMTAEVLDRVFEPFYTTKDRGRGTGLGLAMVYGAMKAHEGWVSAESVVGKGSSFLLHLPLIVVDEPAVSSMDSGELTGGSETVLLVDDARITLKIGRDLLEHFGYTVLTAGDGEEALAVFERYAEEVAVVVTDLIMPCADGRELLQELRDLKADLPVLAMSGYTDGMSQKELFSDGFDGFLSKPFRPQELADLVRSAIDKRKEG